MGPLPRVLAAFASCSIALSLPASAIEPIPVAELFSNPAIEAPRLSPNGERISIVVSRGDEQLVAVRDLAGGPIQYIARADDDELRLKSVWWPNDGHLLLGGTTYNPVAVGMRSRASRLFGISTEEGAKLRWLGRRWPFFARVFQSHQDRVVHDLPDEPDHVLIEYGSAVRRMNVRTGALRVRHSSRDWIYEWSLDDNGDALAGHGTEPNDDYVVIARTDSEAPFHETLRRPHWPDTGPWLLGLSPNPNLLYVSAVKDGYWVLQEWDIQENAPGSVLLQRDGVDIRGLVRGSDRRTPVAVVYVDGPVRYFFLDTKFQASVRSAAASGAARVRAGCRTRTDQPVSPTG